MALDPNIAMGYQGIQLNDPLTQYGNAMKIQGYQTDNQLNQMKMASAQADAANTSKMNQLISDAYDPVSKSINYNDVYAKMAINGQGSRIPDMQLAQAKVAQATGDVQKVNLANNDTKQKHLAQISRDISSNPSDANITANTEDITNSPLYTAAEKAQSKRTQDMLLAMPLEQRTPFLAQQGASSSDLKPVNQQQTLGGTVQSISIPAYGGAATVVPGSQANVTMTPAQIEQNAISRGQLGVSQGTLSLARERFAADQADTSGETTSAQKDAINLAIGEGRLDGNKINSRNYKPLADALLANPNLNLIEQGFANSSATASARKSGAQAASMITAGNELRSMLDVLDKASDALDRTKYPNINALTNAYNKGEGGTQVTDMVAALQAVTNLYPRAVNPNGVSTVAGIAHAREALHEGLNKGQIKGVINIMRQESNIGRNSALQTPEDFKALRETAKGRPPASAAVTPSSGWGTATVKP